MGDLFRVVVFIDNYYVMPPKNASKCVVPGLKVSRNYQVLFFLPRYLFKDFNTYCSDKE